MKGTEKQVAWATDIIKDANEVMDAFVENIDAEGTQIPAQYKDQIVKMVRNAQGKLNNAESASDVIDIRYDVDNCYMSYEKASEGRSVTTGEVVVTYPAKIKNMKSFQMSIASLAKAIEKAF